MGRRGGGRFSTPDAVNAAHRTTPVDKIAAFRDIIRERLKSGDIPFRKANLPAIIDRVEVEDRQMQIMGRKDVLEQAVLANRGPLPGVRSLVRKWRPVGDFEPLLLT